MLGRGDTTAQAQKTFNRSARASQTCVPVKGIFNDFNIGVMCGGDVFGYLRGGAGQLIINDECV